MLAENGPITGGESFTAFVHVGTDFAGPLYVKEGSTMQKVYVYLFTRASSRMIHLKLKHSLTTDKFLQAFSRMQAVEIFAIQWGRTT